MRLLIITAIFSFLFMQATYAVPQVDYKVPASITTTVGELTALQIDIKNTGASAEYYTIKITASSPNEMEITNPNIQTTTLKPSEVTSVYTNIRTLTERNNPITIKIYRDGDTVNPLQIPIPVNSKKFSMPEFGMAGFLQIILLSAIVYFLYQKK